MRIVYMGSPEEAIAPLSYILKHAEGAEVTAVVSQPAKAIGRGRKAQPVDPPVAAFAKSQGLLVLQPPKAKDPDFLEHLRQLRPELVITCAYGQILSQDFLDIPSSGTINIHPSLLPAYRGATPVPSAILAGETTTGVTIAQTVRELDAGPIILQQSSDIAPDEDGGQLLARLLRESGPLLGQAIRAISSGEARYTPQAPERASHCRMVSKEQGRVDWTDSAARLYRQFRAYRPWPGTFTSFRGQRISFDALSMLTLEPDSTDNEKQIGTFVYDQQRKGIVVVCGGETHLLVSRLTPAGRKTQDAAAFWNGIREREGCKFGE